MIIKVNLDFIEKKFSLFSNIHKVNLKENRKKLFNFI